MTFGDALAQLEEQQTYLTAGLRCMLEGLWCGEAPSLEAYVVSLDPSQTVACARPLLASDAPPVAADTLTCWDCWSAEQIASATGCPIEAVQANWPSLHAELVKRDIAMREVQAAILGTVAVETAGTFQPVTEAFWLDDAWRYANLRYAPYWGRGYVQLTWQENYQAYGDALGVDLVNNPDLAKDPAIAAAVMAQYFQERDIPDAALLHDWAEVRRLVQGADAGLDHLLQVVQALGF